MPPKNSPIVAAPAKPKYAAQAFSAWKSYLGDGEEPDIAFIDWKKRVLGEGAGESSGSDIGVRAGGGTGPKRLENVVVGGARESKAGEAKGTMKNEGQAENKENKENKGRSAVLGGRENKRVG